MGIVRIHGRCPCRRRRGRRGRICRRERGCDDSSGNFVPEFLGLSPIPLWTCSCLPPFLLPFSLLFLLLLLSLVCVSFYALSLSHSLLGVCLFSFTFSLLFPLFGCGYAYPLFGLAFLFFPFFFFFSPFLFFFYNFFYFFSHLAPQRFMFIY